ncbi:hypothetical protein ACYZT9_18125 [Pseudomonas sp. ZT5P21]
MNEENTIGNIEQPASDPVTQVGNNANILKPKARSLNVESVADKQRGSGGLDSLGQGYLLVTDE